MQLENFATPPQESPQQRYASLHRAIERGMASDELWTELAVICLDLKLEDEALRAYRQMSPGTLRNALGSKLARRGLLSNDSPERQADTAHQQAMQQARREQRATEVTAPPSAREHLSDAFHYLFLDRMPAYVLLATLAFPLLIGLGGFLTAGGSPLLLPAVTLLPGLCVVGMVGALGRRILMQSAKGDESPPALPELGRLIREASRYLGDVALVLGSLIGPSIVMAFLSMPPSSWLPGALIGALFAPMALVLRQVRGDFKALSPGMLFTAVKRGGKTYLVLTAAFWALFGPAAAVLLLTAGKQPWLQVAAAGPLLVLPVFVSARMLGTFLDSHKADFSGLMGYVAFATSAGGSAIGRRNQKRTAAATGAKAAPASAPRVSSAPAAPVARTAAPAAPAAPAPAATRRPGAPRPQPARQVKAHPAAPAARAPQAAPKAPAAPRAPTAKAPTARPAAPRAAAPAAPASGQVENPNTHKAMMAALHQAVASGPRSVLPLESAVEPVAEDSEADAATLEMMMQLPPGATVLTGNERRRHGASPKRPPR